MNFRKIAYYLSVIVIILISFFLYSSRFYPLLNSDDALNILMAYYYELPNDFYCWGQDRGGTIIPLISQIFIKIFNFSALTSVSLTNYFFLSIGFVCFASLFNSNFYKFLFALIWFLPFQRFVDIVRFPIGVEYSLIACSIFLINKVRYYESNDIRKHLLLILLILIFIISVWVSDLAIVSFSILLLVAIIFTYVKNKKFTVEKTVLFYVLGGIVSCFTFINYAKSFATAETTNYLSLNNLQEVKKGASIIIESFLDVLTFKTDEVIIGTYSYMAIVFFFSFLFFLFRRKLILSLVSEKWFVFFTADFLVILTVILFSSWVLANNMGRWYFVAGYISLSLAILLALEKVEKNNNVTFFKLGLSLIVFLGAVSPIYSMKYERPKTLKPVVDIVSEFQQLGKIGVIAEFWNSYIISVPDPEAIKATPHDQSGIRNQEIVDMVFEMENLYVIKDMWMDSFPDTLEQFGYVLLKEGDPFSLGGCNISKYKKAALHKIFSLPEFKYNESQVAIDSIRGTKIIAAFSACDSCKEKHLIYGTDIPIGIGEFSADFYIKANSFTSDDAIALLDVTADWGTVQLAGKRINKKDFFSDEFNYIKLDFNTSRRYNNVEFRIYYYGNADLYFDHVELTEINAY